MKKFTSVWLALFCASPLACSILPNRNTTTTTTGTTSSGSTGATTGHGHSSTTTTTGGQGTGTTGVSSTSGGSTGGTGAGTTTGGDAKGAPWGDPNATPAPIPTFIPSDYVRTALGPDGAYLAVNGEPFRMLGYNAYLSGVTNFCGWSPSEMHTAFQEMATNSNANVVRLWFFQSAGGPPETGGLGWAAFDNAIAEAKANGMRIIAVLVNQWGDCEPRVNPNEKHYKTLSWYQSGYKIPRDGYPLSHRSYVNAVARRYANEPTIAFWQLVNEAEARDPVSNTCPDDTAAALAIRAFADDLTALIRLSDKNHLISLGTQATGYCGVQGANFEYLHAGSIDMCEVHSYDAQSPAMPTTVADKVAICKALYKPMFMGEVGYCRVPNNPSTAHTNCNTTPSSVNDPNVLAVTLPQRAQHFESRFQAMFDAGMSGVLIWAWSPNDTDLSYGVSAGDPVEDVMKQF